MKYILSLLVITCALSSGCRKKAFVDPLSSVDSSGIEVQEDTAMFHDTVRLSFAPGFEEILIFKKIIPDTKKDGFVRYGDIKNIDSLDVSAMFFEGGYRFISIQGIEYFTKLRYLNMSASYVQTLELNKNSRLEYLDCSGSATDAGWNQSIKKIDVSKCPNLRFLDCSINQLTSLDITHNLKLTEIYCVGNKLKRLDISNNRNLRILDVSVNREMTELYLDNSPELEKLYFAENKFNSIDVRTLKKLKVLSCSGNWRDSLFNSLDISNNTLLEVLDISASAIRKIDLTKNLQLKYLICSSTKLKSIDLSNLKFLKGFDCANSELSSLNARANLNLEFLDIGDTKIRDINLNGNPNLEFFACKYQEYVTDLDFRSCKKIEICQTYGCPNLKTICVDKIPDRQMRSGRRMNGRSI